ncbi:MAG: sugar-binding protein [Planctomycetota bacterium]
MNQLTKLLGGCFALYFGVFHTQAFSQPPIQPRPIPIPEYYLIDDYENDFVSLFNGLNLNGWEQKNGSASYQVVNSTITGTTAKGSPNSFLCTSKSYADFELRFEVKVDDALNSGVQIRSISRPGFKKGRVHGPQVEIESSPGESGFIYSEGTGKGWISPSHVAHQHFKNNSWNSYRVVADGRRIQTWINGKPIEDLFLGDADPASGFIALQVHGVGKKGPFQVQWRNIRIKELDGTESRTAFAAQGIPQIDGKIDPVWNRAPRFLTTREVKQHRTIQNKNEIATAEVRCLWDEEFLYCLAVITDPKVDTDAEQPYEQDSIEWFIDSGLDRKTTYDQNDAQYRTNADGQESFGSTGNVHQYESKVTQTDTGYIVECRFQIPGQLGQKIGFDVQINNNAGNRSRESTAKWNDWTNDAHTDPSKLGTLIFQK